MKEFPKPLENPIVTIYHQTRMSPDVFCERDTQEIKNSITETPETNGPGNLQTRREWDIYVLRHGKPTAYGDTTADLDIDGANQVQAFTENLITDLNQTDGKKAIRILYSNRPRTKQTGFWVELGLKRAIKEERLPDTRILGIRKAHFLNTARILDAVVLDGTDPIDAYQTWLNADDEYYTKLNILHPGDVVDMNLREVAKREKGSMRLGIGERIVEIWSTHEVTIGPLTVQLFPEATQVFSTIGETNIRYGEMMKVTIGPGEHPIFEFRNHTNPRKT